MSRMWWIIILVGAGIGLAVLIGVLGTRNEPAKTEAASSLCSSLKSLETSLKSLSSLDTSTASQSDYQSAVSAVQDDWNQVQSDAEAVQNAPTGELDSAWSSFTSAVKNVPNDSSVSDAMNSISSAAQQVASGRTVDLVVDDVLVTDRQSAEPTGRPRV